MTRYHLIFLSSFAIFIFFLTPNINTGDGGELATASYFLGTAHPSAYPLYLMLGKAFTFMPFGNIAFKVAVMSAACSALSLTLIFWLVLELTTETAAAIFSVTMLLVSYSYFTQSLLVKFYQLNLLLILLIFALWARRLSARREVVDDDATVLLTFFSFGLITANHHTGIIMLGPVAAAWLLLRKDSLSVKTMLHGLVLFLSGFIINIYLLVRGRHDNFFNAVVVDNFHDFYQVITRQSYKQSGTIDAVAGSFGNLAGFWYGFRNFLSVLISNFSIFSCLLFFTGCIFLVRKNYRLFIFLLFAILLYGPFLAKLTLGAATIPEISFYLGAHQYFLPAIALFAVVIGCGFNQIFLWLKASGLRLVPKIMPFIAVFPLVFLVSRATDSNFRTDFVPYQYAKDIYSILPADSVILTYGDNASYQGWYLKLAGRYREDVCQISSGSQSYIHWTLQGCNRKIYSGVFPAFFSQKFTAMVPDMLRDRFYGTDPVKNDSAYDSYMNSGIFSLDYLYYPKDKYLDNAAVTKKEISNFLLRRRLIADKLLNDNGCLTHLTDDLFTRQICSAYVVHLTNMAMQYSGSGYESTGKTVELNVRDTKTGYLQPLYTIAVTERNKPYLLRSTAIQEFNNWKIFYQR